MEFVNVVIDCGNLLVQQCKLSVNIFDSRIHVKMCFLHEYLQVTCTTCVGDVINLEGILILKVGEVVLCLVVETCIQA
jgi:hypothetical protein